MGRTVLKQYMVAFARHIKQTNLAPVKKIQVSFDPFGERVLSARQFLFHMSSARVKQTNPRCQLTANVLSDRSVEPSIECQFTDDHKLVIKTGNLSALEIVREFNKLCQDRV